MATPRRWTGRVVGRRRGLPGGRAVAGALLIALSTVGFFSAYTAATRRPHQLYVVAARTLALGARLEAADLRLAPLDVGDKAVRAQLFGSVTALVGASTLTPIPAGSPLETGEIVGRAGAPGTLEVSLALDRARAVGGTLKAGEDVDVLGTFGSGADSYTTLMVSRVQIVAIGTGTTALGTDPHTEIITFAVPGELEAEAIADAGIAAQVTLVRSSQDTSAPSNADTATGYRPPPNPRGTS